MKRLSSWTFAAMGFLLGCAIVRALWIWWTPLCDETCPANVVGSLYAFLLALPFIWTYAGAIAGASSRSRRRKAVTVAAVLCVTVAIVAGLTVALHAPRPYPVSG